MHKLQIGQFYQLLKMTILKEILSLTIIIQLFTFFFAKVFFLIVVHFIGHLSLDQYGTINAQSENRQVSVDMYCNIQTRMIKT